MIIPPVVGVPYLLIWPSSPRFLTVSPICNICNLSMIRRPIAVEINKDKIKANPERKDTYLNIPAPGKSN